MKNKYLKMATSIAMAAIVLFSLSFANVPAANPVKVDDQEIQGVYGQGCADDCALAAFYSALFLAGAWYYAIPAVIYAGKCADCTSGGGGGGGGYCDPCNNYPGASTDEEYICQYSGGQVAGPASSCGGGGPSLICCYYY